MHIQLCNRQYTIEEEESVAFKYGPLSFISVILNTIHALRHLLGSLDKGNCPVVEQGKCTVPCESIRPP